jgi:hypothetical protein
VKIVEDRLNSLLHDITKTPFDGRLKPFYQLKTILKAVRRPKRDAGENYFKGLNP